MRPAVVGTLDEELPIRDTARIFGNAEGAIMEPDEAARRFRVLHEVHFQAHRGGCEEVPENSLAGTLCAWQFAGAVPEIDARELADGRVICLHDDTLERTTDAGGTLGKTPVSRLTYDEIRGVDAGIKWGAAFRGCRVPLLAELLRSMQGCPWRRLYVELKGPNHPLVASLIRDHGVEGQVLFIHKDESVCEAMLSQFPGSKTMSWCGGSPGAIRQRFERLAATGFRGLRQVQIHFPSEISLSFVREAFTAAHAAGADLQVRPKKPIRRHWAACLRLASAGS
jgi:hypothetical protein